MTKEEMIRKIAEESQITKKQADIAFNTIFEMIQNSMLRHEMIRIPGFGTFTSKHRNQTVGRNPRTGESIVVPAHRVAHFSASKALKEALNGTFFTA